MMNLNKRTNNWRKAIALSACFVFTLSVLPGCKKKTSTYGTEALDVNALIAAGGIDTFQLNTTSVLLDTLSTANRLFGNVGAMNDPKVGTVVASLYTQLTISGAATIPQGSLLGIDSVILSLNYAGYYGKLDPQTFEVYELAEKLSSDSTYRKHSTVTPKPTNLVDPSSAYQTPKTNNKVYIDDDGDGDIDSINPQLRLKLNNTLGQQFITDLISGNSAFTSSGEFLSSGYFKGLKINVSNTTPGSGKGAVLYFNLGSAQTKLTVFYKMDLEPSVQKRLNLQVTSACEDFNHVDINNAGTHLANVLANPLNGQTQFYSQCYNAIPKVDFPTLKNLSSKTVVNNALLYLPVSYQTGNIYYPVNAFVIAYRNENNEFVRIYPNSTASSGITATYSNSQKAFVIDLRWYIQQLIANKIPNTGLYLISDPTYFNCTAERVVFNGPASPYKAKPKLVVKYTEFK